jgi:hypothetical protein
MSETATLPPSAAGIPGETLWTAGKNAEVAGGQVGMAWQLPTVVVARQDLAPWICPRLPRRRLLLPEIPAAFPGNGQ